MFRVVLSVCIISLCATPVWAGFAPPSDLQCVVTPGEPQAEMSWTNNGDYASIEVLVEDASVATLSGSATQFTLPPLTPDSYVVCLRATLVTGLVLTDSCCDVEIEGEGPPTDLLCQVDADGIVAISWQNNGTYIVVEIFVDGELITTVAGTDTSATVTVAEGSHTICIRPRTDAGPLEFVCCEVFFDIVEGELPIDLECSFLATAPGVFVTWSNTDTYSSIEILVDGVVVQTLPGSQMAAAIQGLAPGVHLICVRTYKNGVLLGDVCCEFDFTAIGERPEDLNCGPVAGAVGIGVSWTIMDSYSAIEIYVDGVLDQLLPGSASSALVTGLTDGAHEICVRAYKNGLPLEETCCDVTVGDADRFVRGDCNDDGTFNLGDAIGILSAAFSADSTHSCDDACDANDDGSLNIADAIAALSSLFGGAGPLPGPFPSCDVDPTDDSLGCQEFACP